ncbi:MAG: SBBP repeat-containing protein [Anaerolineales bacterium]|nr:SBBP repeat-containing protein [Anaerolineales bacterium]
MKISRVVAKRQKLVYILTACLMLLSMLTEKSARAGAHPVSGSGPQALGSNPASLRFFETAGDADRYRMRWEDGALWLEPGSVWLSYLPRDGQAGANLKLGFVGANPAARLIASQRLDAQISYLTGNQPSEWRTALPAWGALRYENLYPQVDLVLDLADPAAHAALIPWRLEARPGGDLARIALRIEGAQGVSQAGDDLLLQTSAGLLRIPMPAVIGLDQAQLTALGLQSRPLKITQSGQEIFEVRSPLALSQGAGQYQQGSNPDSLVFSSFLGGSELDNANAVAVDAEGFAYVTGRARSADFPLTPGALDSKASQFDAFVAKISPDGASLEFATFLGGDAQDVGWDIAFEDDNLYLAGETWSSDFPGANGLSGENDLFIVSINKSGAALRYSTVIGGGDQDAAFGVAVQDGLAYACGITYSEDFPASGYQREGDAFVVGLNLNGALTFAELMGGNDVDACFTLALRQDSIYAGGETSSLNFAPGEYKGRRDAFAVKFNQEGERLFSKLIGGAGDDVAYAMALDEAGKLYLAGWTNSADFPVTEGVFAGATDAFLARLDEDGALDFATTLGGSGIDEGRGIALDGSGQAIIAGHTTSQNFPITEDPYQSRNRGANDAFVARLDLGNAPSNRLTYSTYLGGASNDLAEGLAIDAQGDALIVGESSSADFPTTSGAFDIQMGGVQDGFISKLTLGAGQVPMPTVQPPPQPTATDTPVAQATSTPGDAPSPTATSASSQATPAQESPSTPDLTAVIPTLQATGLLPTNTSPPGAGPTAAETQPGTALAAATLSGAAATPAVGTPSAPRTEIPTLSAPVSEEPSAPTASTQTGAIPPSQPEGETPTSGPDTSSQERPGSGRTNYWLIFILAATIVIVAGWLIIRKRK